MFIDEGCAKVVVSSYSLLIRLSAFRPVPVSQVEKTKKAKEGKRTARPAAERYHRSSRFQSVK